MDNHLLESTLARLREQASTPAQAPKPECDLCGDREFVIRGEVAYPCACRRQKTLERVIRTSGLSDTLRKKTFTNFQASPATKGMLATARFYIQNFEDIQGQRGSGMAFTGNVGAGKTHLMAAVANKLLVGGIPVLFVTTPDLMAELRAGQFDDTLEARIATVASAAVVIFDDVAKEKCTEWVATQYFRIVNRRSLENLPTLFTSNHDMDGIAERLGDAVASRLYEMTKGRWVHVEAEDYRVMGGVS